ncbi:hypothetical protein GcC1_210017 [Golovinomyces cichoracearum]|uniref:[histone H3]-trimethyl-L-lysine(9) demethylase n=1 Tax=Golovinomyces cichoracearum TaxID=62708 RepID=A0A420HB43_9PEZI|nr:hypothetical protein GcC1_210017 [Golovinomyces cichoracearum]
MSKSPLSGLHSPPDSNAQKACESDSELSDIDVEMEHNKGSQVKLEPNHIRDGVPVFTPSMEEFHDFEKFITAVNPWGMTHGIVKVIPPKEWLDEQPTLHEEVKKIKIKNPYIQEMNNQGSRGASGNFRQLNLSSNRTYNIVEWRSLCDQLNRQPPAKRGETRRAPEKPVNTSKKSVEVNQCNGEGEIQPAGKMGKPVSHKKKQKEEEVSVGSRRNKYREDNTVIGDEAFKDFDYNLYEEFDDERCQDLEIAYWKHISYAPPIYGGDMPGTLFTDKTKVWDLRNLPGFLNYLDEKVPGINTTYLYIGSWKSTFSWHLEDVDLYSINYLHFGAPKQWYSISQGDRERFEKAMASKWPEEYKHCNQFLRHKTFQISPAALWKEFKIKVNKIAHRPGEFMITFPYGYHAGYNLGYNCAEAVNFAVDEWFPIAEKAKRCECAQQQDSVWVDLNSIRKKLPPSHKWYIGEPKEYYQMFDETEEDENSPDMPTPPHSGSDIKIHTAQKRKNSTKRNKDRRVKRRVTTKASEEPPCILCPNFDFEVLKTDNGKQAHRICGEYIPETSISNGVVQDIKFISKARMGLKCIYCRSKRGACFQCSAAKCTRAYHGTCAAASGVLVQKVWTFSYALDGTEYKEEVYDFRCRFHRPRRDKKIDEAALSADNRTWQYGSSLNSGDVCQVQLLNSEIFAGIVISNNRAEDMLMLKVLFDSTSTHYEVDYKWLLAPPLESALRKPPANAIPMPTSFKAKESLNTNVRQADDLPIARDPFGKNLTWAEFVSKPIDHNPDQAKVDFEKEFQIWYYIGETSTEAKAQYTDDLEKPLHNPESNFLNTLPKPALALSRHSQVASSSSRRASRPLLPLHSVMSTSKSANAKELRKLASLDAQNKSLSKSTPKSAQKKQESTHSRYQSADVESKMTEKLSKNSSPDSSKSNLSSPLTPAGKKKQSSLVLTQPVWPSLNQGNPNTIEFNHQSAPTPTSSHASRVVAQAQLKNKLANPLSRKQNIKLLPKINGKIRSGSNSIQNILIKYNYLRVEHNKDAQSYKSPYRVGGGFMNGYEGTLDGLKKYCETIGLNNIVVNSPSAPKKLKTSFSSGVSYHPAIRKQYQKPQNLPSSLMNKPKNRNTRLNENNPASKSQAQQSTVTHHTKSIFTDSQGHKVEISKKILEPKQESSHLKNCDYKFNSSNPVSFLARDNRIKNSINVGDRYPSISKIVTDQKTTSQFYTQNQNGLSGKMQNILQQGRNAHLPLVQSFNQFHDRAQNPPLSRSQPIIPDVPPDTSTLIERMMNNLKKASDESRNNFR